MHKRIVIGVVLIVLLVAVTGLNSGISSSDITGNAYLTDNYKVRPYHFRGMQRVFAVAAPYQDLYYENTRPDRCVSSGGIWESNKCVCSGGAQWVDTVGCVGEDEKDRVAFAGCMKTRGKWRSMSGDPRGYGIMGRQGRATAILHRLTGFCECMIPHMWSVNKGCVPDPMFRASREFRCWLTDGIWHDVDVTRLPPYEVEEVRDVLIEQEYSLGWCECPPDTEWGALGRPGCWQSF